MTTDTDDRGKRPRPRGRAAETAARPAKVRTARTRLAEVVVVCAKCARRQGLRPRAVRALLKGAAKAAAKEARETEEVPGAGKTGAGKRRGRGREGRRKLCVVESGCLGPCPKRALAVATGASLAAGRVVLLDPAAGPREALVAVLGAGDPPQPPAGSRRDPSRPPISAPLPS